MKKWHLACAVTLSACSAAQSLGPQSERQVDGGPSSAQVEAGVSGLRVFLTSTSYPGNLAGVGGTSDGLAAGDELCAIAAAAGSLGGRWVAYLSSERANASERLADDGPFVTVGKSEVAYASKRAIASGPNVRLVDERGSDRSGTERSFEHWTGSSIAGAAVSECCANWTYQEYDQWGATAYPLPGANTVDRTSCNAERRLLCFEQRTVGAR